MIWSNVFLKYISDWKIIDTQTQLCACVPFVCIIPFQHDFEFVDLYQDHVTCICRMWVCAVLRVSIVLCTRSTATHTQLLTYKTPCSSTLIHPYQQCPHCVTLMSGLFPWFQITRRVSISTWVIFYYAKELLFFILFCTSNNAVMLNACFWLKCVLCILYLLHARVSDVPHHEPCDYCEIIFMRDRKEKRKKKNNLPSVWVHVSIYPWAGSYDTHMLQSNAQCITMHCM